MIMKAALGAGIPNSLIYTTINKVCALGMKATIYAAQSIQLGINDIVVAGGMESMSNAPTYLADARKGSRFGHDSIIGGMLKDGLWDVYNDFAMGICTELCADKHSIPREEQISDLIGRMQKDWPTLACPSNNGLTFWTHEWSEHGTCSESILDEHGYFQSALNLKKQVNLL